MASPIVTGEPDGHILQRYGQPGPHEVGGNLYVATVGEDAMGQTAQMYESTDDGATWTLHDTWQSPFDQTTVLNRQSFISTHPDPLNPDTHLAVLWAFNDIYNLNGWLWWTLWTPGGGFGAHETLYADKGIETGVVPKLTHQWSDGTWWAVTNEDGLRVHERSTGGTWTTYQYGPLTQLHPSASMHLIFDPKNAQVFGVGSTQTGTAGYPKVIYVAQDGTVTEDTVVGTAAPDGLEQQGGPQYTNEPDPHLAFLAEDQDDFAWIFWRTPAGTWDFQSLGFASDGGRAARKLIFDTARSHLENARVTYLFVSNEGTFESKELWQETLDAATGNVIQTQKWGLDPQATGHVELGAWPLLSSEIMAAYVVYRDATSDYDLYFATLEVYADILLGDVQAGASARIALPGQKGASETDVENPGAWTDEAGGSTDLWQSIDDLATETEDDSDYIEVN